MIAADADDWRGLKEILVGHCADLGRDLSEITCSVNVRLDEGIEPAVERARTFIDAGVDLIVLNLPHNATPDDLEPVARAFEPLAGAVASRPEV